MTTLQSALEPIPRKCFAALPTPLQPLPRMEARLQRPGIFIKRDDLTGLGPGGNKIRSLEYLAGEAIQKGCDTMIASGPLQSNLCTLTAAACASLGLSCVLIHNGEEPEKKEGNLLLNSLLGAESHFLGRVTAEERNKRALQLAGEMADRRPYLIRNGATTGVGALGYVNAVPEMMAQIKSLGLPGMTVFAPGGNGGVASGLIYGNALAGFPFRIVIVSVEDSGEMLCSHIESTIREIEDVTGVPFPADLADACTVDDTFRGGGWGQDTEAGSQAVQSFPRETGILIEHIYNSKVLVGMESYIRRGLAEGPVCYLHTGGFGSLFTQF